MDKKIVKINAVDSQGFTKFLTQHEYSELDNGEIESFGGYEGAERVIASFDGNHNFPISILKITYNSKFSSLKHKDFLGAILGLGIKREVVGDILLKGNHAFLFCISFISDYILDNLKNVGNTSVKIEKVSAIDDGYFSEPKLKTIVTPSMRSDAVISHAFNISRSKVVELFKSEKVFVNSVCVCNVSFILKENDIVSVRNKGRIKVKEIKSFTKKGNLSLIIQVY